jgi:hypothetical protein
VNKFMNSRSPPKATAHKHTTIADAADGVVCSSTMTHSTPVCGYVSKFSTLIEPFYDTNAPLWTVCCSDEVGVLLDEHRGTVIRGTA